MSEQNLQRVDRALLIGIDRYDHLTPNLSGCVRDVDDIARFLVETLKTEPTQIRTIVSRLDRSELPVDRATRKNIIAAFRKLAEQTKEGEQIYIHYSGHGIRNDMTILPGIEPDGRDEGIAPTDSGIKDPADYYILDKELGYLIRKISEKQAFVTVILDCCHSASGTRDVAESGSEPPKIRRVWEGGDQRPRTDVNLVVPLAELKAVVVAPDDATSSLVPPPKNYVLLTACRENETAKEYRSNGVFTFFMLEHFHKSGITGLTYRGIQNRVGGSIRLLASSNTWYDEQTPQLEGNGQLVVFGAGSVREPDALVANPQADSTILVEGAGESVGVVTGTTFGLYPPGALDLHDSTREITTVTATEVRINAAVCRVPPGAPRDKLVPGMRAIIVRPGVATIRRRVALVGGTELDLLRQAITDGQGSPFLELANLIGGRPELTVAVQNGQYWISDHQDQPLPRIAPPLIAASGNDQADWETAVKVRQRLEHIVQYRNAWDLRNGDDRSALRDKLAISVERVGTRSAGRVGVNPGDRIRICLHNRSGDEVSAALLYFSPSWEVQRIWPEGSTEFALLGLTNDSGIEVRTMDVQLPEDQALAIDRLKLFATHKKCPTSFDLLRLKTLDTSRAAMRDALRSPRNALEALLDSVGSGSATRELVSIGHTGDWGTAELELETRRTKGA